MKKFLLHMLSVLSLMVYIFSPVISIQARPFHQPFCAVDGTAFRDFNASGDQGVNEPGVASVIVNAYNATDALIETTTTDATGAYTLTQLPPDDEVRIEFEMPAAIDAFLEFGPAGSGSTTSIVFVTCADNAGSINLGLANPGQHCDLNPDVSTTCFVVGDQATGPNSVLDTVISAPNTAGSSDFTPPSSGRFDTPAHDTLAVANQVGSTFGLAYQRQTDTLFAGAFVKRHAGLGTGGPGAIYQIDSGGPSLFTTLTAASGPVHTDGTPYADRPGIDPWLIDAEAFDEVGKTGLGDLTMSDDDSTLWVVNLFDRRLYSIPVDAPGSATSFALPTPCPAAGDARPFAVEFHDGLVYVGITCTAESSQSTAALSASVYAITPTSGAASLVLSFPLTYPRGCIDNATTATCDTEHPAEWLPWTPTFPTTFFSGPVNTYPQPWLSDIEFDNNGDMILGIRDRFGDQSGNNAFSPFTDDTTLYLGITAGDVLRACGGGGSWTLESNGSCGGVTTSGAGNGQGPGGGEFYPGEFLTGFHDELSIGSLLQIPGQGSVISTTFDPVPINTDLFDGGFRWYDNATGDTTQVYRVFNSSIGSPVQLGKANGLGGIEALCPPAPIEIGNRVWFDINQDGQQDPGEEPAAGVTVRLYSGGVLIATTTTNAAGEYLFTSATDNVLFDTDYEIRLDNPADYASGGPLFEWFLTDNDSVSDTTDSDATMVGGFPVISLNTGGPGENNHTYDFGFVQEPPPTDTPTPGTGTPGDNDDTDDDDDNGTPPFIETPTPSPNSCLRIDKEVNPPFAQIGDQVTWTIAVTNACSTARDNVVISDTIPDGLEILSVDSSQGSVDVSGQDITVNIGTLNPGQTVNITIRTRISSGDNVPVIFDNFAFVDGTWDTARVVRASQLVQTGETPWWQGPLMALVIIMVLMGALAVVRRRWQST